MPIPPLSRRSALRGAGVTLASGAVGFVVARARGSSPPGAVGAANAYGPSTAEHGQGLVRLDQVPAGGGLVVADDKVVLVRGPGDSVHGLSAVCTHQGCLVSSVANGVISCPCHGSRFDAQTGAVVSGPATRPLPSVAVVVRDGTVYTT
jgi:Rieske Fe-S protein